MPDMRCFLQKAEARIQDAEVRSQKSEAGSLTPGAGSLNSELIRRSGLKFHLMRAMRGVDCAGGNWRCWLIIMWILIWNFFTAVLSIRFRALRVFNRGGFADDSG